MNLWVRYARGRCGAPWQKRSDVHGLATGQRPPISAYNKGIVRRAHTTEQTDAFIPDACGASFDRAVLNRTAITRFAPKREIAPGMIERLLVRN